MTLMVTSLMEFFKKNLVIWKIKRIVCLFNSAFLNVLNKHAPFKMKMLDITVKVLLKKVPRKQLRKRSLLKNLSNLNKSHENARKYKI